MNSVKLQRRLLSGLVVIAVATASVSESAAQSGTRGPQPVTRSGQSTTRGPMTAPSTMKTRVGLEGYCPVCIIAKQKWEKGDPRIASTYDGVTYYFPGQSIKDMFDANPEKFVPAMNGDCIVCYEKMGKRVPGNIRHAAMHNNRLYLFPSDKEKQGFMSNMRAFENTDLAVGGECIVCLAKFGKHVPGTSEHTVIHDGFRYLFPSDKEAAEFRASPAEYVKAVGAMNKNAAMNTSYRETSSNNVRLAGRSACAGCEFGVTPLSAPDELGLAVVGEDGRVTVVEDAHSRFPAIYKARFAGQQVVVEGTVLKTTGNVSWVRPSSLVVLN